MSDQQNPEVEKPVEDFTANLEKMAAKSVPSSSSFDGESLRREFQTTVDKAREIVAKYPTGGIVDEPIEAGFLKGVKNIEAVRVHDVEGVNLAHAWPETIDKLTSEGRILEVEVRDLSESALETIKKVRSSLPERSRLIITLDSKDPKFAGLRQQEIREQVRQKMRAVLQKPLEGRDYSIFFIDNLENVALTQVQELLVNNPTSIHTEDNGEVWFQPEKPDNPLSLLEIQDGQVIVRPGIKILDKSGTPTPEALEAASFIHVVNGETVHLIFSEDTKLIERDQIWELVHAMSMKPVDYNLYHEVFYQTGQVDHAMSIFGRELQASRVDMAGAAKVKKEYNDFGFDWDPIEYVSRNYGEKVLPEDKEIMRFVIGKLAEFRESGELPLNSLKSIADLGAGPNLYTLMMHMPYVSEDAAMLMADYAPVNRLFLEWFRDGEPEGTIFEPLRGVYQKFEEYMVSIDPVYKGSYEKLRSLLNQSETSIDFVNLYAPDDTDISYDAVTSSAERQKQDIVTSAFVTESMATSDAEFILLTYNVLKNLKVGGHFTLMHMAESEGYNAGVDNNFPASKINLEHAKRMYEMLVGEGNFSVELAEDENEKAREGYEGMIVVTGTLKKPLTSLREIFRLDEKLKSYRK